MSIQFRWFKQYKIEEYKEGHLTFYDVSYLDGGFVLHSARSVMLVQEFFEKCNGVRVPVIYNGIVRSDLIEPEVMSAMCRCVLDNMGDDNDVGGIKRRIERFKRLSDEGYYIVYEGC